MNIKHFIFLSILAFSACQSDVEHAVVHDIVYDNQSSHNIIITKSPNSGLLDSKHQQMPASIPIASGESYTVGDVTSVAACKEMGVVIFDFDITIDYHAMTSALYNITRVGCYQVTDVSDFHREYRYTFTDEDYQYALEHGTKLELGE